MGRSDLQLKVTVAKQSDYKLVARLCRRAVGPQDYVLSILHEVIARKSLFLTWTSGGLVGMTNFERCVDGTGWLNIARTDPDWRRRGVALFLQKQIVAQAKRKAVRKLKLWALATNKASIRACMKGGFEPVCEAAHISCNLRPTKHTEGTPHAKSVSKVSLKELRASRFPREMNGYLGYKRHILYPSPRFLETLLNRKEIYSTHESRFIVTKPETSFGRFRSSFAILDGQFASCLLDVKRTAKGLKAQTVGGFVPYNRYQLVVAKKFGFKVDYWGGHCIVLERKLF
jgi:GNAT superfamily N-acetyltransferase